MFEKFILICTNINLFILPICLYDVFLCNMRDYVHGYIYMWKFTGTSRKVYYFDMCIMNVFGKCIWQSVWYMHLLLYILSFMRVCIRGHILKLVEPHLKSQYVANCHVKDMYFESDRNRFWWFVLLKRQWHIINLYYVWVHTFFYI